MKDSVLAIGGTVSLPPISVIHGHIIVIGRHLSRLFRALPGQNADPPETPAQAPSHLRPAGPAGKRVLHQRKRR
jgi:hypothetical protein